MPIDYKKYPPNWLSEIRPRILKRANYTCEGQGCDFQHLSQVWSYKDEQKTTVWTRTPPEKANAKQVKVILTIAHLDHDETNHEVTDDRLAALCQLCHLRYDAKEKYRRINK